METETSRVEDGQGTVISPDEQGSQCRELTPRSGKNFYQRVEEFSMWKDQGAFQDMEYKRRRSEKMKVKGTIRSDKRLILSNRLYIPAFITLMAGISILLLSNIEGLGKDTVMWNHKHIFHIIGGVFLAIGIISLMTIAAYTYHREDKVRARCGYPSLFMSSLSGVASTKDQEETIMLQNTFVDRKREHSVHFSRLESVDSKVSSVSNTNNALMQSFSSTSTTGSWINKHKEYYRHTRQSTLKRENSDSALDKIYARKRLLNWQMDTSVCSPINVCVVPDPLGGASVTDGKDCKGAVSSGDAFQIESSFSMASSGYCSNISTNIVSQSNVNVRTKPRRQLSEPSRSEAEYQSIKRIRNQTVTSDSFIQDGDSFDEGHHPGVPNIPIIRIECVK